MALRVGPNPVGSVSSLGDAHVGRGHVRTQPEGASAGGNRDPPDHQDSDLPVPCLGHPPRDSGKQRWLWLKPSLQGNMEPSQPGDTVLWFSCLGSHSLSCHPTKFRSSGFPPI